MDGLGFAAGDKVICLRNDRRLDVLNGTIGTVERRRGNSLVVETTDGPRVLAGRLPRGRSPGSRLRDDRPQVPGHDGRARLRALQRVAQPGVGLRGHEQSDPVDRALRPPRRREPDELTHDPRQGEPLDPLVDLTRRLQTSRAKQLALFEAKVVESDGDEETPPKRKSFGPSVGSPEDSGAGLYGVGQAGRGHDDGKSVGGSELSKGPWDTGQVSEIDRRLSESRRRIADELARLGRSRSLEEPDRSRGLGR